MARQVATVQQYLDSALPGLLDAQSADLARVRRELGEFREADAEARRVTCSRLMIAREIVSRC